jgi:CheY-like chemotaxis protein
MTRESEGTGLGLAISRRLVNLMGGEIWVEHTDDPGATLKFTIVMREEADTQLHKDYETGQLSQKQRPLRILVAEDNKINQLVLIKMLENQGHKMRIAENGYEVIEAAKNDLFDIIFMDVHMPGIDGLEAATIIRGMLKEDCPIIIAVTANALKGDREKCLEAGMDDYISKPISTAAVCDMIRKYFSCASSVKTIDLSGS